MQTYQKLATDALLRRQRELKITNLLDGVTPGEWTVLGIVHDRPTTITKIAKHLDCSLAHATNAITKLTIKGLVQRTGDEFDNRSKIVSFTGPEDWFQEKEQALREVLGA